MAIQGPIIIVEDDPEDQELIAHALQELDNRNPLRFFSRAKDALYYLMDTKDIPLLILSDINLPGMDGLEFRRKINESHYLHRKSIPFIFLTTAYLEEHIIRAYDMLVQGYFVKPDSFEALKQLLRLVLDYWTSSLHPNNASNYNLTEVLRRGI